MACSPIGTFVSLARAGLARVAVIMLAASFSFALLISPMTGAASQPSAQVSLVSQSDWVRGPAPMALRLNIQSTSPMSDLGVKVTVYSRLTSRYEFGISETGKEASSELVLGSTPIIPLGLLNRALPRPNTVALGIRFVTTATPKLGPLKRPELALDCLPRSCDGVYPLEVVVVDRLTDKPLASLTTHLIYLAGSPGSYRLKVALLWTLGAQPSLSKAGVAMVSRQAAADLGSTLRVLRAHRQVPMTILAYPQTLLGLSRASNRTASLDLNGLKALALRSKRSRSVEFVGAPFTEVSPAALANAGLSQDFNSQLVAGRATYRGLLGVIPTESPFVAPGRLNDAALTVLSSEHLDQVVIPESNVLTSATTPTAPFDIRPASASGTSSSSSRIEAFVADSGLASHFGSNSNPILAAHNFLADVAQIFFEAPFAPDARGVVVEPQSFPTSTSFLSIVLNGLESSPITKASTLTELFSSVRVGANSSAPEDQLVAAHRVTAGFSSRSVSGARSMLKALESVVPEDRLYIGNASDSVMLSETYGLSNSRSNYFASGPAFALGGVKNSITLSGTRTVTITQRRARVPVTLISTFPSPVHAKLHLESGALTLSPGASHSVVLARKNTPLSVSVDARTSGVSTLAVELVSPRGGFVLLNADFTVRSTAFSIVAVIISAAALAVLFAWWLRTLVRRRRRRAEARRAVVVSPSTDA